MTQLSCRHPRIPLSHSLAQVYGLRNAIGCKQEHNLVRRKGGRRMKLLSRVTAFAHSEAVFSVGFEPVHVQFARNGGAV
jgi:hypothetical protein